jgi:hypothetical protein
MTGIEFLLEIWKKIRCKKNIEDTYLQDLRQNRLSLKDGEMASWPCIETTVIGQSELALSEISITVINLLGFNYGVTQLLGI